MNHRIQIGGVLCSCGVCDDRVPINYPLERGIAPEIISPELNLNEVLCRRPTWEEPEVPAVGIRTDVISPQGFPKQK